MPADFLQLLKMKDVNTSDYVADFEDVNVSGLQYRRGEEYAEMCQIRCQNEGRARG